MPVVVTCRCGQSYEANDKLAGKQVKCLSCGRPLAIPHLESVPSPPPVPPVNLSDSLEFDPPAWSAFDSLAGAGDQPLDAASHTLSYKRRWQSTGLNRSVVLAILLGGAAMAALIMVIVLTVASGGSRNTQRSISAMDHAPDDTPVAVSEDFQPEREKVESNTSATESDVDQSDPLPSATDPPDRDQPENAPPVAGLPGMGSFQEPDKENRQNRTTKYQRPSQSSGPGKQAIQLAAGTALPQTLPSGTAMGFSVDYEFTDGRPDESAIFLWVIKTGDGQTFKKPVQLQCQGTLMSFIPQLRPERGPFQTYIEDRQGTPLSKSIPMR